MRLINTTLDRFYAAIDRRIDRAVARVILRDKSVLAEEVAESYRHLVESSVTPAQVADQMDPRTVAAQVAVDEVARYVDMDELASQVADKVDIDTSEIARNVARNLDMDDLVSHLTDEIDTDDVIEQVAKNVAIDSDAVVEKAAELLADDIDRSDIAAKLAENINWEADVLDYEELAKALLRRFAKSIVQS